jgi:hypothetical protein
VRQHERRQPLDVPVSLVEGIHHGLAVFALEWFAAVSASSKPLIELDKSEAHPGRLAKFMTGVVVTQTDLPRNRVNEVGARQCSSYLHHHRRETCHVSGSRSNSSPQATATRP